MTATKGNNNYFGVLGADAQGLENIIDQTQTSPRLANFVTGNQGTGAGTPTMGTNCPGSGGAPNTWWSVTLPDGSTGYIPVWK